MIWLLALVAFFAAPDAAMAGPAAPVAMTILGVHFGPMGVAALRLVAGVSLSALSAALQSRGPQPQRAGISGQALTAGDQTPQSFILGRYATAGNLVCPDMSHGTDASSERRYLTRVVDLGDIPFTSLEYLIVDGKTCHLATGTPSTLPVTGGDLGGSTAAIDPDYGPTTTRSALTGFLFCKFYDGTQTVADPMLLDRYADYPERPWSADMVGTGVPYAILTFRGRTSPAIWQGIPQVRFVAKGIRLYDPRLDSTAGGSGDHRYGTPATYAWSENPVVMIYNILRGIALPDGSIYGGGFGADDLPYANWAAAMDACDEDVDGAARYIAGYEVRIGTPDVGGEAPLDVVEQLLKACSAQIADMGGTVLIRVGEIGLPAMSITDDDIVVTTAQDLDQFPSRADSYNGVHATYPAPEALWEPKEAPPRYDAAALADDGVPLIADLQLPAVPKGPQVQRLMKAWLADARRFGQHAITLPPDAMKLTPLAAVEWTSARNGYAPADLEVGRMAIDPSTLAVGLSLAVRDAGDYVWMPGDALADPIGSAEPVVLAALAVPGWTVTAAEVTDATGAARRAAVKLAWAADTNGATGVKWQVRVAATGTVVVEGSTDLALAQRVISEGILPATAYQARGRLVSPQLTEWTDWTAVTTGAVYLSDADLDGALADIEADVAAANAAAQQAITDIAVVAQDIALSIPQQVDTAEVIETLAGQVAYLTAMLTTIQQDTASAGLYIDPATGLARLEAVSRFEERIGAVSVTLDAQAAAIELRATQAYVNQVVSNAMIDPSSIPLIDDLQVQIADLVIALDAAEAEIALRATTTTVNGIDVRLTDAEATIGSQGITLGTLTSDLTALDSRVTSAEVAITSIDGAAIQTLLQDSYATADALDTAALEDLEALIQAYEDRQTAQADLAYLREDLSARVAEGESATAALRTELGAAFQNALALVRSEVTARATADSALASDVTQLDARLDLAEAGVAAQSTAISQLTATTDAQGATLVTQAAAITDLESDIAGKADATALNALTTRVEDTEDGITALSAAQLLLTANTDSRVFVRRFVFDGTLGGLTVAPAGVGIAYSTTGSVVPLDKRVLGVTLGAAGYADLTYTLPAPQGWQNRVLRITGRSLQVLGGGVTVRAVVRRQVSLTNTAQQDVTLGVAAVAPSTYGAFTVTVTVPAGPYPVKDVILRLEGSSGNVLNIADLLMEDATDVVTLGASISDLAVATADADSALASRTTVLEADVGGLSATVTTQAAAIADLEGNASASLVFRVDAGAPASLELVSAASPGGAPVSGVRIKGQNIELDGDVTVDGSFTVTGPMIVNGAVSQRLFDASTASLNVVNGSGSPHVLSANLGAMSPVPYASGGGPVIVTVATELIVSVASGLVGVALVIQGRRSDTLAWEYTGLGTSLLLPVAMSGATMPFTQIIVDYLEKLRNPGAYTYTNFRLAAYRIGAGSGNHFISEYAVEIRQINK